MLPVHLDGRGRPNVKAPQILRGQTHIWTGAEMLFIYLLVYPRHLNEDGGES